jgi:hypothetical protein
MLAAESLLAFVAYRPNPDDPRSPELELALVGALLVNEAIGHLRAISRADIKAIVVNVGGDGA